MGEEQYDAYYGRRKSARDLATTNGGEKSCIYPVNEVFAVNSGRPTNSTRNKYPGSLYNDHLKDTFDTYQRESEWGPGELEEVNDLVRESTSMLREDFLLERKNRLNPVVIASEQFKTVIDIENKDFIKRDEAGGQLLKFNIN